MFIEIDETCLELKFACANERCKHYTTTTDLANVLAVGNPMCPECGDEMEYYGNELIVQEDVQK